MSAARRGAQEAAADAAVARSIGRRLGTEPPPAVVSALRRPATCESADALDDAAALLSSLRAHAIAALADDVRATKRVDADASQRLADNCAALGFTRPSRAQADAFGPIVEGDDCVLAHPTGAGKSLAYVAPLVQRLWDLEAEHGRTPRVEGLPAAEPVARRAAG